MFQLEYIICSWHIDAFSLNLKKKWKRTSFVLNIQIHWIEVQFPKSHSLRWLKCSQMKKCCELKFNENEREWNPFVKLSISLTLKIGKIYVFAIDKSTTTDMLWINFIWRQTIEKIDTVFNECMATRRAHQKNEQDLWSEKRIFVKIFVE